MKRGMEKEKKGLFGRMLDFWQEKIWTGETEGIGFWNGGENLENSFTEMGNAVSIRQQEMKTAFWEEKVGTVLEEKEQEGILLEQEKGIFFAERKEEKREPLMKVEEMEEDGRKKGSEAAEEGERTEKRRFSPLFTAEAFREERQAEEGNKTEKSKVSRLFTAEAFWEERQAEVEKGKLKQAFLWEMPEEEREKRSIVPVTEEVKQEKAVAVEEEQEMPKAEKAKQEESQTEAPFDIEKLMQQMTKKLWEERESCGRRLRG